MNKNAESIGTRIKPDAARWERLKNILADALEQPSFEERTAVLRRSCADDPVLLREAEKLLARDTTAFEEFAEFAATCLSQDEFDRIGERIGAYAIMRELGRGGMGAVYLAERADGQFEKRVAIKILKRGTDTDEVLHRFRVERQILANLDHPNITRLLDAGSTNDGLPYVVMEFVEGTPITQFVQQENVDLQGRLKLFLKVCSAVDLAHRNQVIHRDIKPTNVLVKRDGEPKLLDFGVAKLLRVNTENADDMTAAAERRFTPRYASPEQAAGQPATIASDVYSLGALLYQVLTNQPPSPVWKDNLSQEKISKGLTEPQLPSQAVADPETKQQLPGQLDRIVGRAMRRDPAQRYSGVIELSKDIEQYLSGAALRSDRFAAALPASTTGSGNLNGESSRHRRAVVAFIVSAIALAVAFLSRGPIDGWLNRPSIGNAVPAPSPIEVPGTVHSIAVLPFRTLGSEMNNELLGLGMADAVIDRLSKLKRLVVLPTSSVSNYTDRPFDPIATGRTLGVDAVLSGTVQRSGDHLRVTVQLVNVGNGRTVWSEKFDQTFTDIFGVQDSISENVARSLALNVSPDEQKQLGKHSTSNTAAYDSYVMGLYFWNQRSKDALEKAINYFQQSVEKDPNFALAYALLADCYYLQVFYRYNAAPETIGDAKAAAERALVLDDSVAEGHVAMAMVQSLQKNGRLCMESLRRALDLNPNLAVAHLRYAWCLCAFGQLDDAVREMKRAQELDPLSPTNDSALGMMLVYARQFRDSLEYCYKAAELAPNEALIQENLAVSYCLNGRYQEAIEHYQRVAELNPEKKGDVIASVATALISAGRKPEADSMMPEILKLAAAGKADPYTIAVLFAARGEKELAFEWFAKALDADPMMDRLIRYDPQLDTLRSDRRFAESLRQHNRASLLETP